MPRPRRPIIDRLLERVTVGDDGCWNASYLNDQGYGMVYSGGHHSKLLRAHRVTYEHFIGPVPDGLVLDHLCRNRACCNPEHVEPVTQGENTQRGVQKTLQTHCKKGHLLERREGREGLKRRICPVCTRDAQRAYDARKRALRLQQKQSA